MDLSHHSRPNVIIELENHFIYWFVHKYHNSEEIIVKISLQTNFKAQNLIWYGCIHRETRKWKKMNKIRSGVSKCSNIQGESNHVLVGEDYNTTSVIIGGVRSSCASRVKGIFRSTTMPVLNNFSRVGSVHGAPSVHTLKLPLCFS